MSTFQLPQGTVDDSVVKEEAKERLIERLMSDIGEIVKVTEMKPKKAVVMTAPKWKHDMLASALADPTGKPEISSIIKAAMAKVQDPAAKKAVPAYAKELSTDVVRASPEDRKILGAGIDEASVLNSAREFLEAELGCDVHMIAADDPGLQDPKGKARFAKPGRPAVYLE